MKIWRIGSNWGGINLIPIFKEKNIAFAGLEVKSNFDKISTGDIIAITTGQSFIALGLANGLIELKSLGEHLVDEYEDVKAVKISPFFWKEDFPDLDWGYYDGRGKQFHEATGPGYISHIKNLYHEITSIAMNTKYSNELLAAKNMVLTGAPGTGKTYLARQIAESLILTKEKLNDIVVAAFSIYKDFAYDPQAVLAADSGWQYWRGRILSDDFNLDDFANTTANAVGEARLHGSYITNFLERTSSEVYGSSKPGSAYNYGVKMNSNGTYGIGHSDEQFDRDTANEAFEHDIKHWFQGLLDMNFDDQQQMVTIGNIQVRAGQLLRKMVVLEHPAELLSVYQDKTIASAYKYFVNGNDTNYFDQNRKLLTALLERLGLERTKENVFKLNKFVWHYFNEKAPGDMQKSEEDFKSRYMENYTTMVQFHPSYDYADFFEGFRPYMIEGQKDVGFKLKNGTFKEFCIRARQAYEEDIANGGKEIRKFVFIIDEINRAEISKVLGELFFAIDPGYRGEKGKIRTQYANMQTAESCFLYPENDLFYVPENVYIIGTMNDIDRSVESFDFALRRRFAWINIKASEQTGMWNGQIDAWKVVANNKMTALNNGIGGIEGLNESYHIGPAYFLKLHETGGDFELLWQYHIANVVREYFRGMPDADQHMNTLKELFDLA